jgi:hypothetical protein
MIRHVVLFSAKDPKDVEAIQKGLAILAGIPEARHFEVGRNIKKDSWSSEVDIVVYGEFDDEAALKAFKAHPLYEESIRRVRSLRNVRMVADWDPATALGRSPRADRRDSRPPPAAA